MFHRRWTREELVILAAIVAGAVILLILAISSVDSTPVIWQRSHQI